MSLNYSGDLILRAKELRKTATPQERHLWYDFLSRYPVRFQRQKTVGRYIVDFYCHRARLVVELDGSQHYEEQGIARDAERTTYLMQQGLFVLRFSNAEVNREFYAVCEQIDRTVKERVTL